MAVPISPKEKKSLIYKSGNSADVGKPEGAVTCHTSFFLLPLAVIPKVLILS